MPRRAFPCLLATLAVLLISSATATVGQAEKPKAKRKTQPPQSASSTYVGSAACTRCHLSNANQFAKTSMGRSLTAITPDFLKTLPVSATYYDAKSGHHFEVHAEDGKLYQTEFQTDAAGKDIFRNTHQLEWIVGTGENGFGALLRRDSYLFQAPLSYYSRAAHWDLSPGYQNGDYGFNRLIVPGCIYCHSGRPQPIAGYSGKYDATPFQQTSVGCENCLGPGSAHVEAMQAGEETKGADPTIVNPQRLAGQLSDDICISCHQTGDARVLKPGKTYQDFRPGHPLDETVSVFEIPPTRENPPQDDHVEHYYSMSLSKCFRASQTGSSPMRCITCHDPHVEPTGADIPAFYNAKCLTCHTTQSCTEKQETRHATLTTTKVADNCISCHMPKRDVKVISHSSITNHRILARPDEPFPDEAFAQTTAAMPDLIHLNPAGPRADKSKVPAPPALIRLQAYAELLSKKPEYTASWRKTLSEIESSGPSDAESPIAQAALGHRDLQDRRLTEAAAHLNHALQLDPLQPQVYIDLSETADLSGQPEDAITYARKAVELDPFTAPLQKTLVFRLISGKHYEEAEAAMVKYLQNFPEDDFMRKMLAIARE